MVKCSDDTLYTGWTNCLEKRVGSHNAGKASKYTRGRLPVEVVYWEEHENKAEAMKREVEIKQLTRVEKMALCKGFIKPI
jgi:putative endonuclease